ncbi:hypothetical protein [Sphingosinicella xenopeptidilytica]|uniref:Uncharacterized protein n=1 Tax=Sphingosinicella xenopeptidilytica TaxID=364098 RepID=A0ABW3C7X9_SPHXN
MNSLSFGIVVGSIVTAFSFVPRAFPTNVRGLGWTIVIGGFVVASLVGSLKIPDGMGFFSFFLGIVIATIPFWLFGKKRLAAAKTAAEEERRQKDESLRLKKEAEEAKKAEVQRLKQSFLEGMAGWDFKSEGRMMNVSGQPNCFFASGAEGRLLRIVQFIENDEDFQILNDQTIAVNQIMSMNIASPKYQSTEYYKQAIPIVSSEPKKSVVGRSVVGGALFGPAGAIVGGMTGLNNAISTKVEEREFSRFRGQRVSIA